MAITVSHQFVSGKPDGTDATIIQPSNWNDDHAVTGTIDVANGGTGANNSTDARTNLGLGTIATQDASNVNLTGGSIGGVAITSLDSSTVIQDDLDPTKKLKFQVSGVTAGQTRVMSIPDSDGTLLYAGGPLGTPSSGTVTNLTGTASININGTVGGTNPAAGTFTTLASTGNATLGDDPAADTHTINGGLTVKNTGSGNSLLIEDSSSTDSTPVIVNATGKVVVGHTASIPGAFSDEANLQSVNAGTGGLPSGFSTYGFSSTGSVGSTMYLYKSASATAGTNTVVASGDLVGSINWAAADGTTYHRSASIQSLIDGTPGLNDMPGRLVFSTTADGASSPTERMRINSSGLIGVNTSADNGGFVEIGGTGRAVSNSGYGVSQYQTIPATATTQYWCNTTVPSTTASAFTLSDLRHYNAGQGTFGATSAVTNQYGFFAQGTLIGATNNYGFYGNVSSGTGRWNFYAAGTASNYFGGLVDISGASAGQIKFPATQNASADANTLDDYREGTFTPVVRDAAAGNAATTLTSAGFYTKVGRLVEYEINLTDINTAGLTAGNQVFISGLPFTVNSSSFNVTPVRIASGNSTTGCVLANTSAGGTTLELLNSVTTGIAIYTVSQITSGSTDLRISGHYYI